MLKQFNFKGILSQFISSIGIIRETFPFIRKHKLWLGVFDYKWILVLSIFISIFFTFIVYENLVSNYFQGEDIAIVQELDPATKATVTDVKSEGKRGAITGGTKYLLIILLEVILFHFSVKTLSIITEKDKRPTFMEFMKAEKRMIKLMVLNFIKSIIVLVIVSIFCSILGLGFLNPILMFFVYGYFMGYAFLDNYNEQFGNSIKKSKEIIQQHIGAAMGIGTLVSILIYIPLIGPLFGPIFGSVAAAIYGERFKIERINLPIQDL